jgi:hypothetical protein
MALHPSFVGPPRRARAAQLFACGLFTLPLWLACADPDGKFDEFVERTKQPPMTEPDAAPPPPPNDSGVPFLRAEQVTGTYLSVVSTSVSPKKPVVYRLDVTASENEAKLVLTLQDQALAYWDRKTPVGPLSDERSVEVTDQGTYTEMLVATVTPEDANPVTYEESTSDTTFVGQLAAAEVDADTGLVMFWCGTVTGKVYVPMIPFTGTFTISRIVEGSYPETVIDCDKNPADPPPPEKP